MGDEEDVEDLEDVGDGEDWGDGEDVGDGEDGETSSGWRLRPSIGVIAWPLNRVGYVAPPRSTQVAMMSIKCEGSLTSLPLSHPSALPLVIPAGQWAMSGVEMPPSCTQCLYSRKGVLLTLAQPRP